MNPTTLRTAGLALVLGSLIGYFIGVGVGKKSAAPTVLASELAIPTTDTTMAIADASSIDTLPQQAVDTTDSAIAEAPITTTLSTLPSDKLCFADDDQLSLQLSLFAEKLERDSLWYNNREPAKLQDCSGIFHRVVQFVQSKCDSYTYPTPGSARDSRSVAAWYKEQNNLVIIKNPKEQRNLIRPGAVMFFGKSGQVYNNLTAAQVTAGYPDGIVQHIGVVTEVETDDAGNVTGYTMFHGRRPGVTAQRSYYHQLQPPRLGYPILGNWNQQWVGVAYIMTPV